MDRELGLLYVRVPTYCPFRLQVYCNGHSWLAKRAAATARLPGEVGVNPVVARQTNQAFDAPPFGEGP
jgi:lipopolysaccharide biosynthesis protein